MANKLDDQQIMDETINSGLMGAGGVNQQGIEEVLDEVISKVVEDAEQRGASQLLRTEAENRKKKEVLTSSHGRQVLFHLFNLIEYQISHTFQICEI